MSVSSLDASFTVPTSSAFQLWVSAMEFYSQLVERIRLSREEAIQDLNKRKENGLQPYFPLVDWDFIVPANIFYFVFVCVLMLFMKKRSQGFYLKPVITIYNATCVLLAGYVLVELFRYKVIEGQGTSFLLRQFC